jgi:hypothetical protein
MQSTEFVITMTLCFVGMIFSILIDNLYLSFVSEGGLLCVEN